MVTHDSVFVKFSRKDDTGKILEGKDIKVLY